MNLFRPLVITVASAVTAWLFLSLPIPTPPATPTEIGDWWAEHGTPTATVALLRLVGTAAALWVTVVGALATSAAVLRIRLPRVVFRGLPVGLRRSLAGAAMAGIVANPLVANASDVRPAGPVIESIGSEITNRAPVSAGERFMVVDIGPVGDGFVLAEIDTQRFAGKAATGGGSGEGGVRGAVTHDDPGHAAATSRDERDERDEREVPVVKATEPASHTAATEPANHTAATEPASHTKATEPASHTAASGHSTSDTHGIWTRPPHGEQAHSTPASATSAGTWTVQSGDHLWHIAAETVRDGGNDQPDPEEVGRYWRKLIEANRSLLGDDPDLIHPGSRVILPAL